jgi:hypothetical protein
MSSQPAPTPGRRRAGWTALLSVLAVLGLLGQPARLASEIHVLHSRTLAADPIDRRWALDAAVRASELAPWHVAGYRAQLVVPGPDARSYLAAAAEGLRWAPADPYRWAALAQALVVSGRFNDSLALALERINSLAPNAPTLQDLVIRMGIQRWARGNPEIRAQWMASTARALATDPGLLSRLERAGLARELCITQGPHLGLENWCDQESG